MAKKTILNKANVNLFIDTVLLLIMAAMLGIGLMIKYILITGEEKIIRYGSNFRQTVFGMDRHEWGTLHLYIGYVMAGLLILHIILHWKCIVTMFRNFIGNTAVRLSTVVILVLVSLIFVFSPFVIQPQIDFERKHLGIQEGNSINTAYRSNAVEDESRKPGNNEGEGHGRRAYKLLEIDVKGYMSIADVCSKYNISEKYLKEKLNIPAVTDGNTRLRNLKELYGIRMGKIKEIIVNKNKSLNNSIGVKQ